jgi:DUF4097 and DUF4098 domain-containing protein YvlB
MKLATSVTISFLALVSWAASPVSQADDARSLNSVNGNVSATPGQTYDTLSTVNGEVHVGAGATAEQAKTVNGELEIENGAKVGEASTVNGELAIGEDVMIDREASTVNGGISIGERARVGGNVSTVSGEIEIKGAEVSGQVITTNGDINLSNGARVLRGIYVRKPGGSNWGFGKSDQVKVHVCSTCVVEGELRFDRPVELRVDTGGKIGKVIGESVTRR